MYCCCYFFFLLQSRKLFLDTQNINKRIPSICCSLDNERAFDTVWIEGLIFKLYYLFGLNFHLCKCIYNYLKNRSFKIKIDQILSNLFYLAAGTPQGSILSSILYIFMILGMWGFGMSATRSEERRVGKECRSRWSPYH